MSFRNSCARIARILAVCGLAGALVSAEPRQVGAAPPLVIPSSGVVVALFLDTLLPENWFNRYYTPSLALSSPLPRAAHSGLDISYKGPDCSTPVYPAAGGTIIWAHYSGLGLGYEVLIEHKITHGSNVLYTMYSGMSTHLSSGTPCISVAEDHYYGPGAVIGKQASSGRRTGPRLEWTLILGPGLRSNYDASGTSTNPILIPNFYPVSPMAYSCSDGTDYPGGWLKGRWVQQGWTGSMC